MDYTLKDVDDAEALVRRIRPDTLISRDNYDWDLAIRDNESRYEIVLFRSPRGEGPAIASTTEEIESICYYMGSQWTSEQVERIAAASRRHVAKKINRINTPSPPAVIDDDPELTEPREIYSRHRGLVQKMKPPTNGWPSKS